MKTQALRQLLKQEPFVYMPAAYDALGGRLVEDLGFKAVYVGGFVTGGSRCTSEPLLTMDEQVRVAGDVANAVKIPAVADGGAGFGEPLQRGGLNAFPNHADFVFQPRLGRAILP